MHDSELDIPSEVLVQQGSTLEEKSVSQYFCWKNDGCNIWLDSVICFESMAIHDIN